MIFDKKTKNPDLKKHVLIGKKIVKIKFIVLEFVVGFDEQDISLT